MDELKKPRSTKESIFLACFTVIPMIFSANSSEYLTDNLSLRILNSGLLAAAGAMFGYGIYYLTQDKHVALRITVLVILVIIFAFAFNRLREKHEIENAPALVNFAAGKKYNQIL